MEERMGEFIVKLEYNLYPNTETDAVDFLLEAVRMAAQQNLARSVEILRTDVRAPGEIGDW